jgi:hypothetical protein
MTIVWPRVAQPVDGAQQVLHRGGGQSQAELVDDEDLGVVEHDPGEGEHLLLAARQLTARSWRRSARAGNRSSARSIRRCTSAVSRR